MPRSCYEFFYEARRFPLRLLNDLHARARADARRARGDHRLQPFEIADAAGRLDAHLGADDAPHQRDVRRRRAAGTEPGGRLHVVGAGRFRQRARGDLLVVGEQRRLDDDLAERRRSRGTAPVTASMSRSTTRRSPDLSAPTLITMSISRAPSKIARRVS